MTEPPNLGPEPGWHELVPPQTVAGRSFVSGEPQGDRLRVRYFTSEADALVAKVWFGPGAVGPPNHAHGGSLAAVLDEAMGAAAWLAGHVAVAADLHLKFRQMVPLGTVFMVSTRVTTVDGRKVRTAGTLRSLDGAVTYCEADGLFIEVDAEHFGDMAEEAFSVLAGARADGKSDRDAGEG
jgi:acyl-coenzyme A thioesterase PaaI-like protein